MNAFIIHGAYGNPDENWFPWLKKELEKLGLDVVVPQFPTPEDQNLDNWMKVIDEYSIDEDTILIGHSIAPAFLLSVLEKKKVRACFFVAGFTGLLGIDKFDAINKTISDKEFDWSLIKENCSKFYVFHSDNDLYVPLEKGEELARNLGVEVILVKGAGHFSSKTGYDRFDLLLAKIKEEL